MPISERRVLAAMRPEKLKSYLRRHRRKHYHRGPDVGPLGHYLREVFPDAVSLVFPDRLVLFFEANRSVTVAPPRWMSEYLIRLDKEPGQTGAAALRELNATLDALGPDRNEDETPLPRGLGASA